MIFTLIGLMIGILVGYFAPVTIPVVFARYSAIAILGIVDSLFGAWRANLQGKFDQTIFVSGLIFNMVLAVLITYLGDQLNLDLYLAVIIVFTLRIFQNIATVRYSFLTRFLGRKRVQQELFKEES
ncbi:MAG: small basic family protein [Patescibacteria group bacterium]